MTSPALARFRRLVDCPDQDINLAEAALAIAEEEYPELAAAPYLQRLDAMAGEVSRRAPGQAPVTDRILALNRFLFQEQGFRGNKDDYYDPRNSFLNDVMERRVGIPITLSVIYLEMGWRVGLPLEGLSFPGHFLVKCEVPDGAIVLDPYASGNSVGVEELKRRLALVYGRAVTGDEVLNLLLASATRKDVLARMLRNLKAIYLNQSAFPAALSMVERILMLYPHEPAEVRDRGIIYHGLECFRAAQADLERYLELLPRARDARKIRERLAEISGRVARLN